MQLFKCKRCGFCCQLDVTVSEDDINLIRKKGHKDFFEKKNGLVLLKKKGRHCIFYNEGCSIYDIRPSVCQRFPHEKKGIVSERCTTRKDFTSRCERRRIEFLIEAGP
ncbi:MAG: YkgJ family cysteine cluster protein [Candidatus Woesearchaeota archaeon]